MVIGTVILAPRVNRTIKKFVVNNSIFPNKKTYEPITITFFTLGVSTLNGPHVLA